MSNHQTVLEEMIDLAYKVSKGADFLGSLPGEIQDFKFDVAIPLVMKELASGYVNNQGSDVLFSTFLSLLSSHVECGCRMANHITRLEEQRNHVLGMFEHVPAGFMLVEDDGKIVFMSQQASRMVGQHNLIAADSTLRIKNSAINFKLKQLLKSVSSMTMVDYLAHDHDQFVITLPKNDQSELLTLTFVSPQSTIQDSLPSQCVGVFIKPSSSTCELSVAILQQLYGMTAAESRLTCILVKGGEIAVAADELGVSVNTVRSQLKSIYRKTSTSRQAELVYKVLMSPAVVCMPEYKSSYKHD